MTFGRSRGQDGIIEINSMKESLKSWIVAFGFVYIIGTTTFIIHLILEVTFKQVPEANRDYVIMMLGTLITTVLGGGAAITYGLMRAAGGDKEPFDKRPDEEINIKNNGNAETDADPDTDRQAD